ncbi:unnamed protein product [Thelazia callipaeda]|uniref:PH domain-containing protein n=1 Tax=Thelazia callipaeda TaxID=103827 RepID=A0A0N5D9S6_THECL|nr:unnamed protein product [Thelazia callipaeda]
MITVAPVDRLNNGKGWLSEVNSSFNPDIEDSLICAIRDAVAEWKEQSLRGSYAPLDSSSVAARNLITFFDFSLSYGFIGGYRLYWMFVKEFMSRSETKYLKREWCVTSTRQLSVAWLKDSLNKQTLLYYFQSFQQNMEIVLKFYHKEALMASQPTLSRIAWKMMDFSVVQFKFLKPFEKNNDVPIAQMRCSSGNQRPSASNDHVVVPYKSKRENLAVLHEKPQPELSTNLHDFSSALLDVPIPADLVEIYSVPHNDNIAVLENDPDQIFGQLIERERSESLQADRDGLESKDLTNVGSKDVNSFDTNQGDSDVTTTAIPVDPFDIALKNSLSRAKVSLKDIKRNYCEKGASPMPTLADLPCGEIRLDMGEVIDLTINVFKHDAERFMRFFQVYSSFGTGEIGKRLLVLSNQALYLLSVESNSSSGKFYVTRAYLPLRYIDSINVGPDSQVLYFHAEKHHDVYKDEPNFLSVMAVWSACEQLGIAVLDAVEYAHENYVTSFEPEKHKLNIYRDCTPQHYVLSRFISNEFHKDAPVLLGYFLVQWRQADLYSPSTGTGQHSGFLYHKEIRSSVAWLLGPNYFEQSYFHLQNKKLYQFSDSSCKFGERIISLSLKNISLRTMFLRDVTSLKSDDHSPYMFEIILKSSKIQFISQSAADMRKWVSMINAAMTSSDMNDELVTCAACLCENGILLVQEGLNCAIDGFMRLLARIDLASVSQATGVFTAERSACVINSQEKLEWLFMRSSHEVDRLLGQLNQLGVKQIKTEEDGSSRLSAILNSMLGTNDAFHFNDMISDGAFDASVES